ncbi:Si-specific NAD(P)(+) transhydrogenase [Candidatus Aerophobetes bacterium]|uniref:NAD(P)(+) transhydrogenase (Si-specific) n=1 Tax=Aerophobetes bacterium TaxID=2030807 RepID=A0A2A4X657_UNCAE|nr:MAG: Si-specific NAD(P)(+) transhydrogenase [Candidatus Aerophobetes bacterium]
MSVKESFADLVIIGSGPAGQNAAMQASKLGKSAIIIDQHSSPGGGCLFSGTIPSKSLREAILTLTDFYKKNFYGKQEVPKEDISINDLNYCLNQVWEHQTNHFKEIFDRNNITYLQGIAHFESEKLVAVVSAEGQLLHMIHADYILIATGSVPRNPKNVPFDNECVLDSTRLLKLDRVPKTMVVLGGGTIGAEYASFFAALGTKVTVIDKRKRMLSMVDSEISFHFQQALKDLNVTFLGEREFCSIEKRDHGVSVNFTNHPSVEAEVLLYSLGRRAAVDLLHIDKIGISLDARGYVPVNALFQTIVPNIYAVGDVIGGPCLASTSMEQGRLAARHAFGADTHHFPTLYPVGIYTIPEISSCGYNEDELNHLGFKYEVGRALFSEIARNIISGKDSGMFKILFHRDTLEILGVHIIGRQATEMIHIGQVAMDHKAKIDYFIDQVFNYPTYAEGYRIAALNGFNKIKHKN